MRNDVPPSYSDDQLLTDILAKGSARDRALKYIKSTDSPFRKIIIEQYLNSCRLTTREKEKLFTESITRMEKRILENKYNGEKLVLYLIDIQIITDILSRGKARERAFKYMVNPDSHYFVGVSEFLKKRFVSYHDREEIFIDGLLEMEEMVLADRYKGGKLGSYLIGICRRISLKKLRKNLQWLKKKINWGKKKKQNELDPWQYFFVSKELNKVLTGYLMTLGNKCRDVLLMWMNGHSMAEIAETFGFNNTNVAKSTKRRCLKRLLDQIDDSGDLKVFLEDL